MMDTLLPLLLALPCCAPRLFGLGLHFGLAHCLPAAFAEPRQEQKFREAKTELLANNLTSFHGCFLFLLGLPRFHFSAIDASASQRQGLLTRLSVPLEGAGSLLGF